MYLKLSALVSVLAFSQPLVLSGSRSKEQVWFDPREDFLRASDLRFKFLLYVDNRLAMFRERYIDSPSFQAFAGLRWIFTNRQLP